MKAVVTGGAGFIGSHLVNQLLEQDFDVTVIDNFSTGNRQNLQHLISKINLVEADLSISSKCWVECVKSADYVYHLASLADIVPSIERPIDYYNANVTATINVLNHVGENLKKFVYAGSSSCYGICEQVPTPEDASINPEYPYALTKRMGEEIALHWSKVYNIPVVSTRFFNVSGTRSRTNGTYGAVFGVFLAQKLAGKPFTVVGDGTQLRDFTYVTDVCDGILKASFSKYSQEIFNIGSGNPQSINRLVELLGGDVVHIPKTW